MNERIRELAEQSGLSKAQYWMNNAGEIHFEKLVSRQDDHTEEVKKFAELIVRECAKIAWEDSERYATIDNDTIMNGKADVLALCSHHIKEHFGVEE